MADSITVSTQVLVDTAKKVRDCNTKMDSQLTDINKAMNDLQSTWKSDAAEDIRAAMNALKPKFEEYKSVVESYAAFLDKAAQSFEDTEQSVQTYAGQFK